MTKKEKFAGMTFCITGTLSAPRKDIIEFITSNGGAFINSCSSKTSYLVVGENPGGSKLSDAEKHNTPIITEEDLLNL